MHRDAFAALLARQTELESQHANWCESINLDGDDDAYTCGRRDQAYRQLLETEELIEAEIQAERAAENNQEGK